MADLTWHPEAVTDLAATCTHIRRDSPLAAESFAARVIAAVEGIEQFPHSGRMVPEAADQQIREVLIGAYRVIYRLIGVGPQIVMVRHGAQTLREIRDAETQ